ncbi:response regulator [Desulfobacula phenolica]|uniref:Histidine kinase n=1 Tax=Desulfobacula phenolica TaxID=90732 RepID=A0A1H2JPD4_9BACT|nr:response regulator [Desulfobacula phenolica]SDU58203.1 Histidine kinase [Desulfobacula phenolica]
MNNNRSFLSGQAVQAKPPVCKTTMPDFLFNPGGLESREDYHVLVVDDDPDNRYFVKTVLLRENIICQTVSNGLNAIERIKSGQIPRLILLDIVMPGLSGYEVCRILRNFFSSSELPIIMLTKERRTDELLETHQLGANDYLLKPFSKHELIARVRCQLELLQANKIVKTNRDLEKEVQRQKQKKETARLMAEKERLEKLRYQINPHFLFNALSSIRGAVFSDKKAAGQMISHLAEFCRLSLSHGTQNRLTVDQEISFIQHYLFMEKMRFGDYINICVEIKPEVKNVIIPAFVLQPLVENAIKYGTLTSPDFLEVKITIKTHNTDEIFIRISNTGFWISPFNKGGHTGIGLKNIKERLNKFYSGRQCIKKQTNDGQVSIIIILPDTL